MLLVGALAGCAATSPASPNVSSSTASAAPTTSGATGSPGLVAPIMIDFFGGTAQFATVRLGNVVVVTTGGTAVTSFTAAVGDPTIAKFVPGRVEGGVTLNPGIQPLAVGTTTVTITDTETSRFVLLDLTVTR